MKTLKCLAFAAAASLLVATNGASAADDTLYRDLGGQTGMVKIANLLVDQFLADRRIKDTFGNTDLDRLRKMLADQFCVVSGGPCQYTGHSMHDTHKGLHLRNSDFNFVVEDLQKAMEQDNIPFTVQNRLLARLAPMQREIVTR